MLTISGALGFDCYKAKWGILHSDLCSNDAQNALFPTSFDFWSIDCLDLDKRILLRKHKQCCDNINLVIFELCHKLIC